MYIYMCVQSSFFFLPGVLGPPYRHPYLSSLPYVVSCLAVSITVVFFDRGVVRILHALVI